MHIIKHIPHKRRPRFGLNWRRHGRRVSTEKYPEVFQVKETMDTVDNLQDGMQPILYSVKTPEVNQFYNQSSYSSTLNLYYDTLKPFVLIMRALGVLPVSSTAGGKCLLGVELGTSLWNMKKAVLWVAVLCGLIEVYRHFRDVYCLHHKDDVEAPLKRRFNNAEDIHLHTRRRKNLKSHLLKRKGYLHKMLKMNVLM